MPDLSSVLVIIISRIAKAVSLERADSPSAPGLGRQKPPSLVGEELAPGMRKPRMRSWENFFDQLQRRALKQMTSSGL